MSACQQAKAQRRKMVNGYKHLAKIGRPIYKRRDAAAAARHTALTVARENERRMRKGLSKKK